MLYDYRCRKCGHETEAINSIAQRHTNAPSHCGEPMELIIFKNAPMGFVDRDIHYRCPVTNEGVTTRKQRNEIMARNGLIDANDLVNSKTIQARIKKHDKMREVAEAHRAPEHLKREVEKQVKQEARL